MAEQLQELAASLVARGREILAADETVPTLTRRFDALEIPSTERTRRDYREMLFTFPGAVIRSGDGLPGTAYLSANTHALARYAALCQEQGLAPAGHCSVRSLQ